MKTTKNLLAIIGIAALFSCQLMSAQTTPAISKKYSDSQIEKLISDSKSVHSMDIMPDEVLYRKFTADFPNAHDIEWEQAAGIYEVEFDIRSTEYKAYYDSQAELLMYKYDIAISKLPRVVHKAAKSQYPNYRFDDIEKTHCGTEIYYKVELERRDHDVTLFVKEDGTVINTNRMGW